jgi:hypothetical protein
MSAWQDIRTMRAQAPPLVKGERRIVFSSALEQAEQLMRAAADTGPAARPLPLFYALSQAGRAIAAARLRASWRLAGHGLTMPAKDTSKSLLRRVVKLDENAPPQGRRHSFAGVAEATGSPALSATVELGAVWAAIPDLIEPLPQPPEGAWPRPLLVYLTEWWTNPTPLAAQMPFELLVDGLPDDPDPMTKTLADYPTAAGARPHLLKESKVHYGFAAGRVVPVIRWSHRQSWRDLEVIAPDYRGRRMLLPRVAGDALSPLMLWWLLLFGLSSIARYDPELWVEALDVNRSKLAVPIEGALEAALEALPELILASLVTKRG